jgi:hypothetical protein
MIGVTPMEEQEFGGNGAGEKGKASGVLRR